MSLHTTTRRTWTKRQPQDTERRRRPLPDEGSATIWAAALAGLLTTSALAALAFGGAVLARHEAGSAADLAALAAAIHTDADNATTPCTWAEGIARHHNARLVACHCAGEVCEVRTAVDTLWGAATVTARAGPANPDTTHPH